MEYFFYFYFFNHDNRLEVKVWYLFVHNDHTAYKLLDPNEQPLTLVD